METPGWLFSRAVLPGKCIKGLVGLEQYPTYRKQFPACEVH